MPTLEQSLDQLDQLKTQFDKSPARKVAALLRRLVRVNIDDPHSLIRLHELLLFVRAHPHNRAIVRQSEEMLSAFRSRVSRLQAAEIDLSAMEHPEVSGIAGMSV